MTKLIPLAALAAILPLVPATASPTVTNRVVVSFQDLDLGSVRGRAALDRRIARAAEEVCGTASEADLAARNAVRRCRAGTVEIGRAEAYRIAAAIQAAGPTRLAANR
jgi:UrcA family protein